MFNEALQQFPAYFAGLLSSRMTLSSILLPMLRINHDAKPHGLARVLTSVSFGYCDPGYQQEGRIFMLRVR